jgi:hypothetical protein
MSGAGTFERAHGARFFVCSGFLCQSVDEEYGAVRALQYFAGHVPIHPPAHARKPVRRHSDQIDIDLGGVGQNLLGGRAVFHCGVHGGPTLAQRGGDSAHVSGQLDLGLG